MNPHVEMRQDRKEPFRENVVDFSLRKNEKNTSAGPYMYIYIHISILIGM